MRKSMAILTMTVLMTTAAVFTSFAGEWKHDANGWWYNNGDGTYQAGTWFQDVDGNWYYFNDAGYMLANTTTPDGYQVDANGVWNVNAATADNAASMPLGNYYCTSWLQGDVYAPGMIDDVCILKAFSADSATIALEEKDEGMFADFVLIKNSDGSYSEINDDLDYRYVFSPATKSFTYSNEFITATYQYR